MKKQRNTYPPEFKINIILEHIQNGSTIMSIAKKYGINDKLIRKWKSLYIQNPNNAFIKTKKVHQNINNQSCYDNLLAENEQLKTIISQLKAEIKLLKDLNEYINPSIKI